MKWKSLLALVSLHLALEATTITLINDTAFPLIAEIYNAQGTFMARIPLKPFNTGYWNYDMGPFAPQHNTIYTPYTVRWICNTGEQPFDYSSPPKKGEEEKKTPEYQTLFGVWNSAQTGSTINASSSSGPCNCVTRKPQEEDANEPTPPTPDAIQNDSFINDGGDFPNGGPGGSASEIFPPPASPYKTSPSKIPNNQ